MKTISGTIPASILYAVGEEACEKYDREYWAAVDKKKSVFVGKTTRTDPKFQAYVAPLVALTNMKPLNPIEVKAIAPAPTPQEKAVESWIDWTGGKEGPFEGPLDCEYMRQDGYIGRSKMTGQMLGWMHDERNLSSKFFIIAYRLAPSESPQ